MNDSVEIGFAELAPKQYPVGEPCRECGRALSRYNPSRTCGPCRLRLSLVIADERGPSRELQRDEDEGGDGLVWGRREPVRRGPLGI